MTLLEKLAERVTDALIEARQRPAEGLEYIEADEGEVLIEQSGMLLAHRVECRTPIGCRDCGRLIRVRTILLEPFFP